MTTALLDEGYVVEENKGTKPKYSTWVNPNLKGLAKDYIQLYFAELSLFNGGPIPKSLLFRTECISTVLNTRICDGCDQAHTSLGELTSSERRKMQKQGTISPNSERIISILNRCAKLRIPKCYAAGIMLIHLELCEGREVCLTNNKSKKRRQMQPV